MDITIPTRVYDKLTDEQLEIFGGRRSTYGANDVTVTLRRLSNEHLVALRAGFVDVQKEGVKGVGLLINDLDRWTTAVQEGSSGQTKPRTLRQFSDLLVEFFRTSPGHRVYKKDNGGHWLAYYVNRIEYHPPRNDGRNYYAAYVNMNALFYFLGNTLNENQTFHADDCNRKTVVKALADSGFFAETLELREEYLKYAELYRQILPLVGKQYIVSGFGRPVTDGHGVYSKAMMSEGVPAKVVIDVASESGDREPVHTRAGRMDGRFWLRNKPATTTEKSDSLDEDSLDEDGGVVPEIPVHLYIPIYHLSRHDRYTIYITDLEEYIYNKKLGGALVLPDITKNLVDTLVSQGRVSFQDIIAGKGSGVCILLGGPPGVGKTLTAEVFAEATERPLLNVQAAQLGIDSKTIERSLELFLARGSRWNAVVLLDEADVYIYERGTDLQQNAIVAAFLRILEHHTATIFMTTNRLDKVDDAIASRCLARIDYKMPPVSAQRRIWGVLNTLNQTNLSESTLDAIVENHNDLSGRDIKQMLKLATLWAESRNEPVTKETIGFVRAFLPTRALDNGA